MSPNPQPGQQPAPAGFDFEWCLEVIDVLKETPLEITKLVRVVDPTSLPPAIAAQVPRGTVCIEKSIVADASIGSAYWLLFDQCRAGRTFAHLPAVYACQAEGECLRVLMERVEGETLEQLVERQGPSAELAAAVMPSVCDALTQLHTAFAFPLIHRDLKPSNVMVRDGQACLIDLSIARRYQEGAEEDTTHLGTRAFAPPEQFGYQQTTVRSDVYALGHLAAYCLTGKMPDGTKPPSVEPVFQPVIDKATAFDPVNRHESAARFKEDFVKAVKRADEDTRSRATARFSVLGRVWNAVLAVVFAVLLAGCVTAFATPSEPIDSYPVWIRALVYLVFFPLFFAGLGAAAADKRRLRTRWPRLKAFTAPVCLAVAAGAFAGMVFTIFLDYLWR